MRLLKYAPLLLILVPFLFTGCTSMLLVRSNWGGKNIVVNGNDKDWGDTMFYIPTASLTAGVKNNSKYLYLVLKTTSRRQAFQIRGLGLTVWFDPSGGAGKDFGIHFPIGHQMRSGRGRGPNGEADSARQYASFVMRNPNQLELLGVSKNGPLKMTIADLKGIQLQMRGTDNGLVYEMRVPLHSSAEDPYAINPKGDQIGIGFEGGEFQRPSFRGQEGRRGEYGGGEGMPGGEGGEMPGGMEGEGYGGRRGGYSREEGARRETPQQIGFWLKVDLSPGPQHAPDVK